MLDTVNHVPVVTPVDSNTRTTFVAEPSLSGSLLRYTAPPARCITAVIITIILFSFNFLACSFVLVGFKIIIIIIIIIYNETLYIFQRIPVALQRFNSMLLHDSFPDNIPDR